MGLDGVDSGQQDGEGEVEEGPIPQEPGYGIHLRQIHPHPVNEAAACRAVRHIEDYSISGNTG